MTAQTENNKKLARRIFDEMWNGANPGLAKEIFLHPEGVEAFVSSFLAAFPDLAHRVEDLIAEGDQVVIRFSARGTQQGRWKEFPASGRPIHYTGLTLSRIAEDKIVEHQTWWETYQFIQQISAAAA